MALLLLSGCASFDPVTKVLGDLGWTPTGQFNAVVASWQDERAVLQSVGYFSGPVGRAPQFRVALPWGQSTIRVHIPPPAPGDRPDGEQPSACSNAWVAALALAVGRTDEFGQRIFEHPVPRTIHLVLPSPLAGVAIGRTSAGASFADTELWIAAPNPETLPCHDDREPLLWAAGVMETIAHEMQHIQAYQVPPAPPPLLGDEVSASMVGHCFRYLVLGGLPYDMVRAVRSDGTELTSIRDVLTQVAQGQMLTSMAGKVIADLHRRHRLGPGEVRGPAGEQLLRLCLARRSEFGVPSDPEPSLGAGPPAPPGPLNSKSTPPT